MGQIITYNNPLEGNPNQCFCQIKFENGERILISQSRDGIKILKLLFGFIPIKLIVSFGFFDKRLERFICKDLKATLIIDHFVKRISAMKSINEVKNFISNLNSNV